MLYIIFFLWFRQWRSCADLVLAPNMNIRFPLFLSIWRRARGQDLATCAGLSHGYDYSYCIALEQKPQKGLAIVIPWIVNNTWNTMAQGEGFLTLNPQWARLLTRSKHIWSSQTRCWTWACQVGQVTPSGCWKFSSSKKHRSICNLLHWWKQSPASKKLNEFNFLIINLAD